mgnify:FL=1
MNDTNYQEEVIKRLDAILEALKDIKTDSNKGLEGVKDQIQAQTNLMRFYQSNGSNGTKEQPKQTESK